MDTDDLLLRIVSVSGRLVRGDFLSLIMLARGAARGACRLQAQQATLLAHGRALSVASRYGLKSEAGRWIVCLLSRNVARTQGQHYSARPVRRCAWVPCRAGECHCTPIVMIPVGNSCIVVYAEPSECPDGPSEPNRQTRQVDQCLTPSAHPYSTCRNSGGTSHCSAVKVTLASGRAMRPHPCSSTRWAIIFIT